jgi:hypothetical protein
MRPTDKTRNRDLPRGDQSTHDAEWADYLDNLKAGTQTMSLQGQVA